MESRSIFLVSYVDERPWWPMQTQHRKKEERERLRGGGGERSDEVYLY